jgi:hypothetical protein
VYLYKQPIIVNVRMIVMVNIVKNVELNKLVLKKESTLFL